ncbi:hypothetical protein DSO57_1028020 [Entomophthora muscae]|uniref:Uncharacterized protein n=1 Tax=Entomophthora muscae TaxID=34485 RepID=A0ACC2TZW6_9FUNG|nr:hypothetical protein DSO57_1028020 [Entomophthora muscae]
MANHEIEALRAREEKSVEIMACWRDDNKALSHKIASLEAMLLKTLSQEGNDNKSQGQDNAWIHHTAPKQFCIDAQKVHYIAEQLKGKARQWYTKKILKGDELLHNYLNFCKHLLFTISPKLSTEELCDQISSFYQGKMAFRIY